MTKLKVPINKPVWNIPNATMLSNLEFSQLIFNQLQLQNYLMMPNICIKREKSFTSRTYRDPLLQHRLQLIYYTFHYETLALHDHVLVDFCLHAYILLATHNV